MKPRKLIIVINGATGVGKTTTAQYLSRMFNYTCISTDYVRRKLREKLCRLQCPLLFRSSYELEHNSINADCGAVVANYLAQAALILREINCHYVTSEERCVVLEGVHLNTDTLSMLEDKTYVALYLKMPDSKEHRRRLRQRNLPDSALIRKHHAHLRSIRAIGAFLDQQWTLEAQKNQRVFLIDAWLGLDTIARTLIGWSIRSGTQIGAASGDCATNYNSVPRGLSISGTSKQ